MKFRTPYTERPYQRTEKGNNLVPVRELVIGEDGKKKVKIVGETDLQEIIDAEAPNVDIHVILARFEAGDETILEKAKGFYADVSELPVKLQDVMNLNKQAADFFDSLPVKMKALYGDDYQQFLFDPGKLVDAINKQDHKNKVDNVNQVNQEVTEVDNKE